MTNGREELQLIINEIVSEEVALLSELREITPSDEAYTTASITAKLTDRLLKEIS